MRRIRTDIVLAVALLVAVAALTLPAGPAAGDETSAPAASEAAEPAAHSPTPVAKKDDDLGGVSAQSTCTADCGPYQDVSCTAPGTCTATDRNCNAGRRGHVTCSTGTIFCAEPCPCYVEKTCPDWTILSCWGSDPNACDGGEWACYVSCDGETTYCPGHWGEETC